MGGQYCSFQPRPWSDNARLAMAFFAVCVWCLSGKSCVPDPGLKPRPALAWDPAVSWLPGAPVGEGVAWYWVTDHQTEPFPDVTARSLKQAARLLNRAADVAGRNEGLAIQFIRQAIAIRKHDVIRTFNMPDVDHVTTMPPRPFTAPLALTEEVAVPTEGRSRS